MRLAHTAHMAVGVEKGEGGAGPGSLCMCSPCICDWCSPWLL